MFWVNALSLDMIAQKIDDMLSEKYMLLAQIHTKICFDFKPLKNMFFG